MRYLLKRGNRVEQESDYKLLKIGELAAMAGISVKAMRVYEKKNIIKPVQIDEETGYRYYSPDQFQLLEALQALQDMGFSLNEIALILSGDCTKEELSALFEEKKGLLQELIWKTEQKIKELEVVKKSYEEAAGTDKMKNMTEDERARYLAKLTVLNEENIRQTLSEVLWL